MNPAILPLPFDPARLRGLSERLLESHHQNNYGGAVKRLHAIRAELAVLDWTTSPGFRINGLKREELVAANSMALHELYFACLGGDGKLKPAGKPAGFGVGLTRDFGSFERWFAEFTALATAYVAAFMENINWDGVAPRYAAAVHGSTATLAIEADKIPQPSALKRIDVRRKGAYEAAPELIEGAVWRDPEKVDEWAAELAGTEVVVYCVFGHEVGQSTAARLRDAGVTARYLTGGIEDWKSSGRPVQPK